MMIQNLWYTAKAVLIGKEVYSSKILPQDVRNISVKQPKLIPKAIRVKRTNKPKVGRRKEITKIRAEVDGDEEKK